MTADLVRGDCLEVMRGMRSSSVDLVICDMPYGTTRCKWDTPLDLDALWREYRRIVKPTGAILLFAQTPFDKALGASNFRDLRYELIWEKTSATGHLNAKRAPMKAHENILVFYRKQPKYTPEKTSGHVRKTAVRRKDSSPLYGKQRETAYDSTERYPRSVMRFSSDKQREKLHPTQKPVDLLRYLVRLYSVPGDVVLDNCMGSGSTGVAAIIEGRKFIGIEKDLGWFKIAERRIFAKAEAAIQPKRKRRRRTSATVPAEPAPSHGRKFQRAA